MDELLAAAGTQPARRASHRVLSPQELVDLAEGGLVEVGAHTVSHAQLSALPIDQQREEIGQSKTQLERILDASGERRSPIHTGRDWITPARR